MRHGHKGLTLVEVVVTVAVLGIAVLAIDQAWVLFAAGYGRTTEQAYRQERAVAVLRELVDGAGDEPGLRAACEVRTASGGDGIAYAVRRAGGERRVVEYYLVGSEVYRSARDWYDGWPEWTGGSVALTGVSAFSINSESGGLYRITLSLQGEPGIALVTGVQARNAPR
ncbi:MAG: prepilin-type N-terminal cleavage/methylation domain-containing protein [Bacillota bacterium]|nr:prepilin-type N-terminal cleavage/methylation domain-containing protein [Bacillota bacterium]